LGCFAVVPTIAQELRGRVKKLNSCGFAGLTIVGARGARRRI
jgi:hypothetical protein